MCNTNENTHRREAIPMQTLWPGFFSEQETEERNHINVAIVKMISLKNIILGCTQRYTLWRNHICAHIVIRLSCRAIILSIA